MNRQAVTRGLRTRMSRGFLIVLLLVTTIQGISGSSTPGQDPEAGLIAYWSFDEPKGARIVNSAGNQLNGLLCGARRVRGWKGLALQFDGIDDYVVVDADDDLAIRDALTLAAWVRVDQLPSLPFGNDFRFILAKSSLRAFSLVLERDGTISGSVWVDGTRRRVRSLAPLPLDKWVHVAFTYDGVSGQSRLYIQGALVKEAGGNAGDVEVNEAPVLLGSMRLMASDPETSGGLRIFPGAIDEVRIYNRALSPEEVRAQSEEATDPGVPPPLIPLRFETELDGRPSYIRIIIRSQEGCPELLFTEASTGEGAPASDRSIGQAEISLPPGLYLVTVDRGAGFTGEPVAYRLVVPAAPIPASPHLIEFDQNEPTLRDLPQQVTPEVPFPPLLLRFNPLQRFNPRERGYYSADLHVHTHASGDAVTPIATSVLAQLAADLDLVMISDQDTVAGHSIFTEEAERRDVPFLLSEEITTESWGHFNVYSLRSGEFVGVSPQKTPAEYFSEARAKGAAIIQVNHPYWGGGQGYFTRMGDPKFDRGFDVVEVWNGFRGKLNVTDERAQQALFDLWNQGVAVTAVGGSDDHNSNVLIAETGWPRTYVYVEGEVTAERWLEGLKAQRAFVTTGPLVYLRAQGQVGPGAHLSLKTGSPLRFDVELESIRKLRALQLWHNGQEVQTFPLDGHTALLSWEEVVREAGWYAIIVGADEGSTALTNPVWVELASD